MVKVILFFLILIGIMVYPVFESKNIKTFKEYKIHLPPVVLYKGKFFEYEPNLTKKGSFTQLVVDNKYKAFDLYLKNLQKKEEIFVKFATYKEPIVKGKEVKYFSDEYNVSANEAVYNTKTAILKGRFFEIYSNSFRGNGEDFVVKEKDFNATKITYFLKVKE